MKTCLIMGAGGFLGRSLCQELLNEYNIVAFDRFFPEELRELSGCIRLIEGNFVDTTDFSNILEGVDIVFHLISTTVPSEDTSAIDIEIIQNVVPTVRLLESMARVGTKEIVFFSSGGTVYGEGKCAHKTSDELRPICGYGMQKRTIESYIEFYANYYGFGYKILRISNPYGIGQDPSKPQGIIPIYVYRLFNEMPITVFGDGNTERDYIHISDLMHQIHNLLEYSGEEHVFNLGTGKGHTINQIIELIEKFSGKDFIKIDYLPQRKCDVSKSVLDVNATNQATNWHPEISLEKGIVEVINHYSRKRG